jgi:hypothetical protein
MTADEQKKQSEPAYSISEVQEGDQANTYLVTITLDGKRLGEVTIKSTTTATDEIYYPTKSDDDANPR